MMKNTEKTLTLFLLIVSLVVFFLVGIKFNSTFNISTIILGVIGCALGVLISSVFVFSIRFYRKSKSKSKVFIAYSNADHEFVDKLIDELKRSHINVFNEFELHSIGRDLYDNVNEDLNIVDYVIVIVSKNALNNRFLNTIISLSKSKEKKIIPIVIDKSEIPRSISNYFSFDTSEDKNIDSTTESIVDKLTHAI